MRPAALLLAALSLAACNQFRSSLFNRGSSREDRNRQFVSPVEPITERNLGLPQIRAKLAERQGSVKTLIAGLELVAGGGVGKQQFQANLAVQPPGFLRVRGSQNQVTVFDILVKGEQVKFVTFPDRRYFDGTLAQLRANPEMLAGFYPEQLVENFTVEQTLLRRLNSNREQPLLYRTRGHYIVRFDNATGSASESYHLREADLLVDYYENQEGGKKTGGIRFWAYELASGKYLLPTQFVVELPGGGRFSANVRDMRVNEAVSPTLQQLEVPAGFRPVAPR
jgi:hypothetical protein